MTGARRPARARLLAGAIALNAIALVVLTLGPARVIDAARGMATGDSPSTPAPAWDILQRTQAGDIEAVFRVRSATITTADQVEIDLALSAPAALVPAPFDPAPDDAFAAAGWTVADRVAYGAEPDTRAGRLQWRWSWTLEPFLDARYEIPPIRVALSDASAIETPGAAVEVTPLLIEAEAADPASFLGAYRDAAEEIDEPGPALLERPTGRLGLGLILTIAAWTLGLTVLHAARRRPGPEDAATLCALADALADDDPGAERALRRAVRACVYEATGRRVGTLTATDAESLPVADPAVRARLLHAVRADEAGRFGPTAGTPRALREILAIARGLPDGQSRDGGATP